MLVVVLNSSINWWFYLKFTTQWSLSLFFFPWSITETVHTYSKNIFVGLQKMSHMICLCWCVCVYMSESVGGVRKNNKNNKNKVSAAEPSAKERESFNTLHPPQPQPGPSSFLFFSFHIQQKNRVDLFLENVQQGC